MKTFILIHGSWHGAWNWHLVVPLLESRGHRALAIDLPGMGRDKTTTSKITMEYTVQKIVDAIDKQEGKVILVGHSKNGIMISQAAEYRPEKIECLVYLAAYLIPDGRTQREYSQLDLQGVLKPFVRISDDKRTSTLEQEIYHSGLYHDCPEYITELAKLLLSPEQIESGAKPLQLTSERYGSVPRIYIECTEDRAVTPFIQQKMYTETPCRKVYQLPSSHSPFFSMPSKLVQILCDL